ncbi:MAG: rod shape-determining protein MreC [Actinobacteria bacterium]|nr:rod shape-determining protein MreC [Actinomycetota bacterium]
MFDRQRRARWVLALLLVASLAIVSVGFRSKGQSPFDKLGHIALTILGPIQKGLVVVFRPVGHFFAGFTEVPSLRGKIDMLQRQNASLQLQEEQFQDLSRENGELRALLQMKARYNLKTLAAQVTGVAPSNFGRTIFIDKGSRAGIRKDMPVVGADGLVGRVVKVGPAEAVVLLLVDRASSVAARLASNGEQGLVQGTGSSGLSFRLIDPTAKVALGDRVLTSGYDRGLFPPGIPIGTITDIPPPAGGATTRTVTVQPFADFSSLDYVLLVTGFTR